MMSKKDTVLKILDGVVHPETGHGLTEGGFVAEVSLTDEAVGVVLKFARGREPFSSSLRRQAAAALSEAFPGMAVSVEVFSSEAAATGKAVGSRRVSTERKEDTPSRRLPGVAHVVAVASGKGGVGKSTVAAHLAVELAVEGFRVGVLDADIYGPSQPALFGVSGYMPVANGKGADAEIVPAKSMGVEIMSIGFFISLSDALVWRGPMAVNALRQLIHQTEWGELDFLIVDLPPGTGDVHLSLVHELELDGAVVVSTPQSLSLADVRRGVEMFKGEGIGVPILGIVENMAWFSPVELPDNRYFIFGKGGARRLAAEIGVEFLGEIPVVQSVMDNCETGLSPQGLSAAIRPETEPYYRAIARRIVSKVTGEC